MSLNLDTTLEDEKELLRLKEKVKNIEQKLKEANKPKTITISGKSHNIIKRYCSTFNVNIGEWVESVLLAEIERNNCVLDNKDNDTDIIRDIKNEMSIKWIDEKQRKRELIKSNKVILSKELKFIGYSYVDNQPIYEFTGLDMVHFKNKHKIEELDIKFTKAESYEISKQLKTTYEEDIIILDFSSIKYERNQEPLLSNFFEPPVVKIY